MPSRDFRSEMTGGARVMLRYKPLWWWHLSKKKFVCMLCIRSVWHICLPCFSIRQKHLSITLNYTASTVTADLRRSCFTMHSPRSTAGAWRHDQNSTERNRCHWRCWLPALVTGKEKKRCFGYLRKHNLIFYSAFQHYISEVLCNHNHVIKSLFKRVRIMGFFLE